MTYSYRVPGSGRPSARRFARPLARGGGALFVLVLGAALLKVVVLGVTSLAFGFALDPVPVAPALAGSDATAGVGADASLDSLRKVVATLESAVKATAPRGSYITVDKHNNRLWLRKGKETLVDAVVSTGSGTVLKETSGPQRTWKFETPSGRHKILSERPNPVWTKPDWAFLEEGRQPPTSISERREKGSLGEWALDLGDGYMIHGTLYERLLGRSLTHGCIRVGRDDLRALARAVGPGTPVFIF